MEELCDELLVNILEFLTWRELLLCSELNKRFYRIATSDLLWKKQCSQNGWDMDERHIYEEGFERNSNRISEELIREVSPHEIEQRTKHRPGVWSSYFNLFSCFYKTNQPCIPSDLTILTKYANGGKYWRSGPIPGTYILVRPSTFTKSHMEDIDPNEDEVINILYSSRGRFIMRVVGNNVRSDESLFWESGIALSALLPNIDDEFNVCPFCYAEPSSWRVIMRHVMLLSHEDSGEMEAQCLICSKYFLYGIFYGC